MKGSKTPEGGRGTRIYSTATQKIAERNGIELTKRN
jgi:hypothetical protein